MYIRTYLCNRHNVLLSYVQMFYLISVLMFPFVLFDYNYNRTKIEQMLPTVRLSLNDEKIWI